jgi:tRNA (mo5U34)-methyltransferase
LSFFKNIAKKLPPVQRHLDEVNALVNRYNQLAQSAMDYQNQIGELQVERAALQREVEDLRARVGSGLQAADWSDLRETKERLREEGRRNGPFSTISIRIPAAPGLDSTTFTEWITHLVKSEPYWFQKIEVLDSLYSPGWSDPKTEKLPYYGLPEDLTGMRVLDIGCAEGFFSFEAERRGAREVIGIDSFPDSVRRFNIVRAARQSNATAFLMNVYDLDPKRLGTFDLVLFYGVFYHLKHPQHALERIRSVCSGKLLFQTHIAEEFRGQPWAHFFPHGMKSGAYGEQYDPTIFWLFNSTCCEAILEHVGFENLKVVSDSPLPFVVSADSPERSAGVPPLQVDSPWC